jgi:hypothetical protein
MRERDLFSVLRRAGCIPRNCAGMSRARCISNVGLLGRAFNRNGRDNPRAKGGSAAGGGGEGGEGERRSVSRISTKSCDFAIYRDTPACAHLPRAYPRLCPAPPSFRFLAT